MISLPTQPNQQTRRKGGQNPPSGTVSGAAFRTPWRQERARTLDLPIVVAESRRQLVILIWLLIFSIASYHLVSRYVVTAVVVQGRSMMPTLKDGDRYILNRLSYHYREPQRGELVVIQDRGHNDYAVKRIVGMPGESVQVKAGHVYLNGQLQKEPYLDPGTETFCPFSKQMLVILGSKQYFVLGDNRRISEDSRTYGAIHRGQIIGLLAR